MSIGWNRLWCKGDARRRTDLKPERSDRVAATPSSACAAPPPLIRSAGNGDGPCSDWVATAAQSWRITRCYKPAHRWVAAFPTASEERKSNRAAHHGRRGRRARRRGRRRHTGAAAPPISALKASTFHARAPALWDDCGGHPVRPAAIRAAGDGKDSLPPHSLQSCAPLRTHELLP